MVLCFTLSVGWSDGNAFQVLMDIGVLDPGDHFYCEDFLNLRIFFKNLKHFCAIEKISKSRKIVTYQKNYPQGLKRLNPSKPEKCDQPTIRQTK